MSSVYKSKTSDKVADAVAEAVQSFFSNTNKALEKKDTVLKYSTGPSSTTKTKETVMSTKGKKQKGTAIERTIRRVEKVTAFQRLSTRLKRWIEIEPSEVAKQSLSELVEMLDTVSNLQPKLNEKLTLLKQQGYTPPKKQFGVVKLEVGRHVWIKPKWLDDYTKTYPQAVLDDLYIAGLGAKKVILSVGEPQANPDSVKLLVAKSNLQANPPYEKQVSA